MEHRVALLLLLGVLQAKAQSNYAEVAFYDWDTTCATPSNHGFFKSQSAGACTNVNWNAEIASLKLSSSGDGTIQAYSDQDCATAVAAFGTAGTVSGSACGITGSGGSIKVVSYETAFPAVGIKTYSYVSAGAAATTCESDLSNNYYAVYPYYYLSECYRTESDSFKTMGCDVSVTGIPSQGTSSLQYSDTACQQTKLPACNYAGAPLTCFTSTALSPTTCTVQNSGSGAYPWMRSDFSTCSVNSAARVQWSGLFMIATLVVFIGMHW